MNDSSEDTTAREAPTQWTLSVDRSRSTPALLIVPVSLSPKIKLTQSTDISEHQFSCHPPLPVPASQNHCLGPQGGAQGGETASVVCGSDGSGNWDDNVLCLESALGFAPERCGLGGSGERVPSHTRGGVQRARSPERVYRRKMQCTGPADPLRARLTSVIAQSYSSLFPITVG